MRFTLTISLLLSLVCQAQYDTLRLRGYTFQNAGSPGGGGTFPYIINEDFEGATPLAGIGVQKCCDYSQTVGNYFGRNCIRFALYDTDPLASSGTRTEIKIYDIDDLTEVEPEDLERWYSMDIYMPDTSWAYDATEDIWFQFHQSGGLSPSVAIETRADTMRLRSRLLDGSSAENGPNDKASFGGTILKNQWVHYVFHIKWSLASDGHIEAWRNGSKILNVTGANMYPVPGPSELENPKLKLGIYKWEWNGSQTTDVSKRIYYMDNIKVAGKAATYADML